MPVTPLSHPREHLAGEGGFVLFLWLVQSSLFFLDFSFLLFSFSGCHRPHCSPLVVLSLWSTPLYLKGHSLAMRSSTKASGSRETLFLSVMPAFSSSPVCLCQQMWFLGPPLIIAGIPSFSDKDDLGEQISLYILGATSPGCCLCDGCVT